jgi:hypothetical protein
MTQDGIDFEKREMEFFCREARRRFCHWFGSRILFVASPDFAA